MYKYKYKHHEFLSEHLMTATEIATWLRSVKVLSEPRSTDNVQVTVEKGYVHQGQLLYRKSHSEHVHPFTRSRTREEYEKELAELAEALSEIPVEFHSFVSNYAYEAGHASGYDEVLGIATTLVYELKPCIQKYATSLRSPSAS